jgi:hypothetical protein
VHAAGAVEHDDKPDRLRRVVELRDPLRLPVVADLERVARQVRGDPAVVIGDGREDADHVAGAAEHRLLECRNSDDPEPAGGERREDQPPIHFHTSSVPAGTCSSHTTAGVPTNNRAAASV